MLAWLAVGRISTLVLKPRATAARATAAPTKPEAPVTRTTSLMVEAHAREGLAAFDALPIDQRRHAQHDLTRPLEQRYGQAQFRGKPEQRRQHGVPRLLYANGSGNENGDAADGAKQRFQCHSIGYGDLA